MGKTELFTIGYGGRGIDEFVKLLREYEIEALVDVRSQPYSGYHADFNRETLSQILRGYGLAYVFMGDSLGGRPEDAECFVAGKLNAARCEERDWYRRGIEELKALAGERRLVMMCSEKDPVNCHRSYVLGETVVKDEGFDVVHIDREGKLTKQAALPEVVYQERLF